MKMLLILAFPLCFLILTSVNLFSSKEINITSDKMEVYEDSGVAVFTGKVYAQTRDIRLWADKLYVYYVRRETKRDIQRLIALGRVKIEKNKWTAVAGKATYFRDQERLVLEDMPKVWHEDNLVEGDLIVIYFNEDRSEVFSREGGRVRVRIYER
ncbi:MAG: lipopolysaccharide transport periplasmic protein LptA [Caldimicrobium sp.]|nr:lipopolysaccharide transport periplasmic protein LptA [Caldimicrobium sp.]MCX7874121.1 lipopolysaccharide transport periplasmic protein LptA [Caldimicrobium sp.]MDW8093744.1 lipopolysaccharide transport periplasmic protein LptA [Caldimicrobium sp.]